ncbi:MAG: glycoside hydrolase family 31 protein [Lachnospiraceae bacterium]
MNVFRVENHSLKFHYDAEEVWIQPWGENSFRIRATKMPDMQKENWALTMEIEMCECEIKTFETYATIKNGKINAKITQYGKITIYNDKGEVLLDEYLRNRTDVFAEYCSALEVEAREFRGIIGGDYKLTMRFVSNPEEKIYGMGQYQQPYLNLKGTDIELAQRNSQASVPFYISSLGYGLLWNNPAIGRAVFGKNITSFEAYSTKELDYWITAGDTPAQIEEAYAKATGTVPMMPDYAMGFWQCKLRYQTQEELLSVAREYKKRGLPISVIVIDYFHWPLQGDWRFDSKYWPDPKAMIKELQELNIELMISIWPTVDYQSENYEEMKEKGYLIRTERGIRIAMDFQGNTLHCDTTHPEARKFLWEKAKENYYDLGIKTFWLDEAEPEYTTYDFDNYRYYLGPNIQVGNIYPLMYAKAFFDGMEKEGQEGIINLLRCAWAGSQKYGALVWSGDIHSSFSSLRNQVAAGLNMGIAGIPWWTTDIGGFHGGDPSDPKFQELLIRWFEYGTFCPVMRLHGFREPIKEPMGKEGGASCVSGADNEVWSFGDEAYEICKTYLTLREKMKPYITTLMEAAHKKGTPIMRTLFYEFPTDKRAWEIEDEYLFGDKILVAPILYEEVEQREVYLPKGSAWKHYWSGIVYEGGQTVLVAAPIDQLPIFLRDKFELM